MVLKQSEQYRQAPLHLTIEHDHLFTGPGFDGGFLLKCDDPNLNGIIDSESEKPDSEAKRCFLRCMI